MPPATAHTGRDHRLRDLLVPIAIGLAISGGIGVWSAFGPLSLPGLALFAPLALAALGALLVVRPAWLAALAPGLMPAPVAFSVVFPFELPLAALALLQIVTGLRHRAGWVWRLSAVESFNLGFVAWAYFTGMWAHDFSWYANGVHRLAVGVLALWSGLRLARFVPRATFEIGLGLGAVTLAVSALTKRVSLGRSEEVLAFDRAQATDLGWGTANYIATLLLLLSPLLLAIVLRPGRVVARVAAGAAYVLIGIMQGVIASRAAAVLFFVGSFVLLFGRRSRRDVAIAIAIAGVLIGILVSPLGQSILFRFTSLRELGSMAVRVWYLRVAWTRVVENFPFGFGLSQGWTYSDRLYGIDPHNFWFAVASELGLPGLLLWIGLLIAVWRAISRIARDPAWQGVGRALQVAFWLGQFHTLVEPTFQGVHYQFLYFWLFGGYLGYHAAAARAAAAPAPSPRPDSSR
jgi:hypothetical protein